MKGKLDKRLVSAWKKGHEVANEVIAAERRERLRSLSVEEAMSEFAALCEIWEASPKDGDFAALDRAQAAFLVARREKFDIASRHRRTHGQSL